MPVANATVVAEPSGVIVEVSQSRTTPLALRAAPFV